MNRKRPTSGEACSGISSSIMSGDMPTGGAATSNMSKPFLRRNSGLMKKIADTKTHRYVPKGGFLTQPHEVDSVIPLGGKPAGIRQGGGRLGGKDAVSDISRAPALAGSRIPPSGGLRQTGAGPANQRLDSRSGMKAGTLQNSSENRNLTPLVVPPLSQQPSAARQLQYGQRGTDAGYEDGSTNRASANTNVALSRENSVLSRQQSGCSNTLVSGVAVPAEDARVAARLGTENTKDAHVLPPVAEARDISDACTEGLDPYTPTEAAETLSPELYLMEDGYPWSESTEDRSSPTRTSGRPHADSHRCEHRSSLPFSRSGPASSGALAPKLAPWGSRAAAGVPHIAGRLGLCNAQPEVVVDSEEMRLKAERQRITRMRAHLETALARLQQEKATFDSHKVEQTAKWEATRDEEARRLKRERRALDQQMRAVVKLPTRKERSEVEAVEAVLDQERRTACEKESRYKLEINKLRSQLKEMQKSVSDLQREVHWHEAERLKEWDRAEAAQPGFAPTTSSPTTSSAVAGLLDVSFEALDLGSMPERPVHGSHPLRQPSGDKADSAPPIDRGRAISSPPLQNPRAASYPESLLYGCHIEKQPFEGSSSPLAVKIATGSPSVAPCQLPDLYGSSGSEFISNTQECELSDRRHLAGGDNPSDSNYPATIRSPCSARIGAAFSWDDFNVPHVPLEDTAYIQAKSMPQLSESGKLEDLSMPDLGPIVSDSSTSKVIEERGTVKETGTDGTVIRFSNGDIKRTSYGLVNYWYAEVKTWHTTYPSGLEVFHFENGQTEAHHPSPDRYKEILYANGSARIVEEDGLELEVQCMELSAAVKAARPQL